MKVDAPYAVLAELTHACPLRCAYCSNPLALEPRSNQLTTFEWQRVIQEAADAGVLQLHLSGGEPLLRRDLTELVQTAAECGLYTNLITSGVGLTKAKAQSLAAAGLNSIQISIQDSEADALKKITGLDCLENKIKACRVVKELQPEVPLCINIVLHKHNIERLESMVRVGVDCGASRIELANVQFYGWAFENRINLLPSAEQLERAFEQYRKLKEEHARIEMIWVLSDYHQPFPKACMGGWGRLQFTVTPSGIVMPCPAAGVCVDLQFESVRQHSIKWIWEQSHSFNIFRGSNWMSAPCNTCERKEIDFGGCRCQALMITGNAANTDPVCQFSDQHEKISRLLNDSKDVILKLRETCSS